MIDYKGLIISKECWDKFDEVLDYSCVASWTYRKHQEVYDLTNVKETLMMFVNNFNFLELEDIAVGVDDLITNPPNPWSKDLGSYQSWIDKFSNDIILEDIAVNGDLCIRLGVVDQNLNIIDEVDLSYIGDFQIWREVEEVPNYYEFTFYLRYNFFSHEIYLDRGNRLKLPSAIINHNKQVFNASLKSFGMATSWDKISFESRKPYYLDLGESAILG